MMNQSDGWMGNGMSGWMGGGTWFWPVVCVLVVVLLIVAVAKLTKK